MKHFFERFGWMVLLVLTIILSATVLSMFFSAVVVVICLGVLMMILGLGIVLWLFRRYFVNLILICILFVSLTSLLYMTGVFNGYVGIVFKAIDIKQDVKVDGDVIVDGNVVVNKDVEVKGNTILQDVIAGNITVKDVITGNVTAENVTVNKDVTVKGNVVVEKDVTVKGNVVVEKDVTVKGDVNVEKDVNIDGDVNIGGDINVDGEINIPTPTPVTETPVIETPVIETRVTPSTIAVTGITVSPATMDIKVGESFNATATVSPSNATNKNVTWSSNSNSVATVSSNGTIAGLSQGTAVVTARTEDGGYTDTCVVTVTANTIAVTGITVSPATMNLKVGENSNATATVSPSNATNKNVTWSSNSNSVATVSSNGTITGLSKGTAVITATTADGGYTDTCIVTVTEVVIVAPNATAKITFGDHIDGATEIFASVVISEVGKTPTIDSNLSYSITKISDKVYHVKMVITEGSHGTLAVSVSGTGITSAESTMKY